MATLTPEQVRFKKDRDVEALSATIMEQLCNMDGHWWCQAPAAMMELLSVLASPDPMSHFLDEVSKMLSSCRACGRAYHNKVQEWRATVDLEPDEAESVVSALREWGASRLVSSIKTNIAKHMVYCDVMEAGRIQACTEDMLAEVLSDMRLVLRVEDSRYLDLLIAEIEVALPDSLRPPLPGVYALSFSKYHRSRDWEIRALYQYEECSAPPGVKSIVQAVVERILAVDRGQIDSKSGSLIAECVSDEAATKIFVARREENCCGLLGVAAQRRKSSRAVAPSPSYFNKKAKDFYLTQ